MIVNLLPPAQLNDYPPRKGEQSMEFIGKESKKFVLADNKK